MEPTIPSDGDHDESVDREEEMEQVEITEDNTSGAASKSKQSQFDEAQCPIPFGSRYILCRVTSPPSPQDSSDSEVDPEHGGFYGIQKTV